MTSATLTLDDIEPLEGTVETGGDYIRFRTDAPLDPDTIGPLHKGRIEIEGRVEQVMLKTAQPHRARPGDQDDASGSLELTLQRFQAAPT